MRFLFSLLCLAFLFSCSSGPKSIEGGPEPAWTHGSSRTVDNGYIVYVGVGEDRTLEGSRFKAEGVAIQDLANECSLAPKGARIEDRYDEEVGKGRRSYAKIGVTFEECEEAKKAVDPDSIRQLANLQLTEELQRYQQTVDLAETQPAPEPSPVATPGGQTQVVEYWGRPAYAGPTVIVAPVDYYVVRQNVVYAKETVILSPANAYPPGAPQTTQFVNSVRPATTVIHQYEQANPTVRAAPTTWSSLPNRPPVSPPPAYRAMSAQRAYSRSALNRGRPNTFRPPPKPKRRKRKQGRQRARHRISFLDYRRRGERSEAIS